MVFPVLKEAVACIDDETAESDQQGGRKGSENGLRALESHRCPEVETDGETSTHEAGEQSHENAAGEIEVFYGFLFLLFRE